jgi:hypothetical protein
MQARAARPEKIGLEYMIWAVRTEKLTGDTAGYGQVVPLVRPFETALIMMWHAGRAFFAGVSGAGVGSAGIRAALLSDGR